MGTPVSGSASQEFGFELVRGLWPNLSEEDKQQMPKSCGESRTCGAVFADISRTGQINTHARCANPRDAAFGPFLFA